MTMVSEAENDGELTDRESELIRSAIEDVYKRQEIFFPRHWYCFVKGHSPPNNAIFINVYLLSLIHI